MSIVSFGTRESVELYGGPYDGLELSISGALPYRINHEGEIYERTHVEMGSLRRYICAALLVKEP